MRIAIVSTPFASVPPVGYGGTELVVQQLCEGLSARGHAVTLYATGDSHVPGELRALFPRPRWPPNAADDRAHAHFAMSDIGARRWEFDLIHTHSPIAVSLGSGCEGLPTVHTLHHAPEPSCTALYRQHPEVQYVAISRRQLALEGPLRHAAVVHHGLPVEAYPLGSLDPAQPYLAFLGRLSRCKGPAAALDIAAAVGWKIQVAGRAHPEPGEGEYFERRVRPRLDSPGVCYLGEVGLAAKVRLLGGASALLFPLEWEEPFGLVAIEAMLCGCPVLAYPRGALPELIEEGSTGFLVQTAEAMAERIRDGVPGFDRERCRRRARERFSTDRMVEGYLAVYRRALERAQLGSQDFERSRRPELGGAL